VKKSREAKKREKVRKLFDITKKKSFLLQLIENLEEKKSLTGTDDIEN